MATLKTLKGQIYSKPKRAIKEAVHTAGTYVASVSKECTEILTLELSDEEREAWFKEREKGKKAQSKKSSGGKAKKNEPITPKEQLKNT